MDRLKEKLTEIRNMNQDIASVMDAICENNRRQIIFLCSIGMVIFPVLIVLGFFDIGITPGDMLAYAATFAAAVVVYFLVRAKANPSNGLTMLVTYLTMGLILFYGLVISYSAPEQYTVTFIALLCILSMTFVDKPVRIGTAHILVTGICAGMIWNHKSPSVRISDLINVISFSSLSFVGGYITVNAKVYGFLLDKRQEQDIQLGRQRLNAVEAEALQLLTAIRSTHDMVVSVNLTKNTYKLIGEESFVTHGDAVEGNFDEVIDLHASRVVEAHRQRYRDTFSRQGLLSAYAAGKREVYLEYQQCDENGVPHWLGTHTMFIETPHSSDITEITISQNIDARMRREEETKAILEAERDRAEQAQKAKTDFLFQMSHDIRTPMNAIIGFANFIKSSDDLDAIHNNYSVKLETAGQQLLLLINDALEMSRIESGKLEFHREVQDVRAIITNVMAVMQIQAEEKGVALVSDFSMKHPIVFCDPNHMSRVIMNLLSNAVKFTPSGGSVTISMQEEPESPEGCTAFTLKVADTGIGMSPEFLAKAFEPFEREQTSTASGMQGTGLGLAIVKRTVEAAGDTVKVESTPGKGTVFTLHMTLYRAVDGEMEETPGQDQGPTIEQMSELFKDRRVLLVEDNEFNLIIAQVLLENAGFNVETATNGRSAVNKVKKAPRPDYYDLILMDIQMPILDGYEATREIRGLSDERAGTIILAVTANAFDTDKENALAAGMDGHLAKPIDVSELYKTLWNILKS